MPGQHTRWWSTCAWLRLDFHSCTVREGLAFIARRRRRQRCQRTSGCTARTPPAAPSWSGAPTSARRARRTARTAKGVKHSPRTSACLRHAHACLCIYCTSDVACADRRQLLCCTGAVSCVAAVLLLEAHAGCGCDQRGGTCAGLHGCLDAGSCAGSAGSHRTRAPTAPPLLWAPTSPATQVCMSTPGPQPTALSSCPCRGSQVASLDAQLTNGVNAPAGVLELAQKEKWQQCPKCRSMVERIMGCNYMVPSSRLAFPTRHRLRHCV